MINAHHLRHLSRRMRESGVACRVVHGNATARFTPAIDEYACASQLDAASTSLDARCSRRRELRTVRDWASSMPPRNSHAAHATVCTLTAMRIGLELGGATCGIPEAISMTTAIEVPAAVAIPILETA